MSESDKIEMTEMATVSASKGPIRINLVIKEPQITKEV